MIEFASILFAQAKGLGALILGFGGVIPGVGESDDTFSKFHKAW